MKFVDEYRDGELAGRLTQRIAQLSTRNLTLMEFCGGHTHAIMRYGIRDLLRRTVEMRSGPGCPVCVTSATDLDSIIALAQVPGTIITTFGDMVRVPGSRWSLQQAKAAGGDVRMVYSTVDALQIARTNPDKSVVFAAIGFETTAPTVAAAILMAEREHIENFYILSLLKLTPPVIRALLQSGEVGVDGIIGPGHVSTIIGSRPYHFIPEDYDVGCVISGFEPLDILLSIGRLVEQIACGQPAVEIAYPRSVRVEGNRRALEIMDEAFVMSSASWRGIGSVPDSGLQIRSSYRQFDAREAFDLSVPPATEPPGCRCGDVIRGVAFPVDCPLFGKLCTPEHPTGPCMVSSEGACAAYYRYQPATMERNMSG